MAFSIVSDDELKAIRNELASKSFSGKVKAKEIQEQIAKRGSTIDVSTIRGRFCAMGEPLSQTQEETQEEAKEKSEVKKEEIKEKEEVLIRTVVHKKPEFNIPDEFKVYIPEAGHFDNYIERGIDKRLAIHYNSGKFPMTQGKQGTGKSFGHEYYAFTHGLPLFVYTCNPDFKLEKLFGDKTIENGSVVFREANFCKGIQIPSVHVFDEIQQVENKNLSSFHSIMQERRLFVKDANNGHGKWYTLHPECRIGFSQNPKSSKYIGGTVKPSNFLGRCTFITYPEFKPEDIKRAIEKKFPNLSQKNVKDFVTFYFACVQTIEEGNIPVDISIRQLNSVIELWLAGLPLREAIEDGLTSIMEATSQPKNKEAFWRLAQAVWKELTDEDKINKLSSEFKSLLWRV